MENEKCPTCGSAVRVEGKTTKYYVPDDQDYSKRNIELNKRIVELEAELDNTISVDARMYVELSRNYDSLTSALRVCKKTLNWIERFYQMECNDKVSNQLVEVRNKAMQALNHEAVKGIE